MWWKSVIKMLWQNQCYGKWIRTDAGSAKLTASHQPFIRAEMCSDSERYTHRNARVTAHESIPNQNLHHIKIYGDKLIGLYMDLCRSYVVGLDQHTHLNWYLDTSSSCPYQYDSWTQAQTSFQSKTTLKSQLSFKSPFTISSFVPKPSKLCGSRLLKKHYNHHMTNKQLKYTKIQVPHKGASTPNRINLL